MAAVAPGRPRASPGASAAGGEAGARRSGPGGGVGAFRGPGQSGQRGRRTESRVLCSPVFYRFIQTRRLQGGGKAGQLQLSVGSGRAPLGQDIKAGQVTFKASPL